MKLRVAFFLLVVCLTLIVFSCRRNQPSLVDANRPPDTELWYSPPDSTEYNYLVHLYWRGLDLDGVVERFIWTITDTLVEGPLRWNPSERVADLRRGRITSVTDSVFSFTAFRNVGGVGLKKNRQAFHIAAIDDQGVIDPEPAAIEFVATVDKLPEIRFTTHITRVEPGFPPQETVRPFDPTRLDTVGMFRPFKISYHGVTTNGLLRGYKFFPLTAGVDLPGADVWSDDLGDTLRVFPNVGNELIESGEFRLAAQARDDAGAESAVDAGRFTTGVARVVVNFEPNTRIVKILNSYVVDGVAFEDSVNFRDSKPDTVPYKSWLTLKYDGRDSKFDSSLCTTVGNDPRVGVTLGDETNKCLAYQIQYTRVGDLDNGQSQISSTIRWRPDLPRDSNFQATSDTTTLNMGPQDYTFRVRAVDEYGKSDGTPATARVIGNLPPDIDDFAIKNWDGEAVADGDTLVWDWWHPANGADTLIFDPPNIIIRKSWFFVIEASGHDHPKEPEGSGVWSWFARFRDVDNPSFIPNIGRSGTWASGDVANAYSDTIRLEVRYDFATDPGGQVAFDTQLPGYLFRTYDFSILGRDFKQGNQFEQLMWLCPRDGCCVNNSASPPKCTVPEDPFLPDTPIPQKEPVRINLYGVASLARWTGALGQRIHMTMTR